MTVFVRTHSGDAFTVDVSPDASVRDVIAAARAAGLQPNASLSFQRQFLSPDALFSDVGICAESMLTAELPIQTFDAEKSDYLDLNPDLTEATFLRSASTAIVSGNEQSVKFRMTELYQRDAIVIGIWARSIATFDFTGFGGISSYQDIRKGDIVEVAVHYDGDNVKEVSYKVNKNEPIVRGVGAKFAGKVKKNEWEFFIYLPGRSEASQYPVITLLE